MNVKGRTLPRPSSALWAALLKEQARRGWQQKQMAYALGIQRTHYTAFLNGKRGLPYSALCNAYALGISADVILGPRKK